MSEKSVRIVTVAYNPGIELAVMAESLRHATARPYELVIVDNGSEEQMVDGVASAYGAHVVRTGENLGYGPAANLGVRWVLPGSSGRHSVASQPEWIVVINPDAAFLPGALDRLLDEARWWPLGGCFGPLIRDVDGSVYPSARRFPRLVSGAGHALLTRVWPGNPFSRSYRGEDGPQGGRKGGLRVGRDGGREGRLQDGWQDARVVDWLSGACLVIRPEAFEAVGGFDESYFMFFEDTQLGEDLARAGWTSVYVPAAELIHEQGKSWKERPASMLRAHHRSAAHYLDGVYHRPWQAPLRGMLRLGLRLREEFQVRAVK